MHYAVLQDNEDVWKLLKTIKNLNFNTVNFKGENCFDFCDLNKKERIMRIINENEKTE